MEIYEHYNIHALVAAVIKQAAADAGAGDAEALTWLESDGALWADAIGIDLYQAIPRWLDKGCPKPDPLPPQVYQRVTA